MESRDKLLAIYITGVTLLFAIGIVSLAVRDVSAASRVSGATVQAGTVTFDPGNDTHLIAYFPIDFPDAPVIVASLQTETPVEYVSAVAFSGKVGAIIVELQEPVSGPVVVNWIATMATGGNVTAVEEGR